MLSHNKRPKNYALVSLCFVIVFLMTPMASNPGDISHANTDSNLIFLDERSLAESNEIYADSSSSDELDMNCFQKKKKHCGNFFTENPVRVILAIIIIWSTYVVIYSIINIYNSEKPIIDSVTKITKTMYQVYYDSEINKMVYLE